MSYVCASTGTCEAVPASPGSPLFSNLAACAATCHVPDISFGCSPQLGCHVVQAAPNATKGLYSNMESCAATCSSRKPPVGDFSYMCSPGLGCHLMHAAPNAAIGLYSNMESCTATCSTPKPPRPEENLKCTVNCVME